jgi:hypothetical protein
LEPIRPSPALFGERVREELLDMEDERKDLRTLFFDIAHCAIAFNILDNHTEDHHCSTIVRDQETPTADFQLLEPWVGHIEDAPLLFISSNPSIGDDRHGKRSSADKKYGIHTCDSLILTPDTRRTAFTLRKRMVAYEKLMFAIGLSYVAARRSHWFVSPSLASTMR